MNLGDLQISYQTITYCGTRYYVTTGTGERSFGRELGGSCAFAYDADDVDALPHQESYSDFCGEMQTEEDRDLAIYLAAREEVRLTKTGTCEGVLSDDEYRLVRATVDALS